ncbi:probable G-protein coupled receptor 33 [Varanus komodoensis]|uniref:probable G-protein coupled receptor 33 n=1 Tax=Varanus komodoensis TaxID=61221 RepID=UPI001CF7778E|nr:probable G-protein coupled receptor 33 [Varanus komodoensis]
MAIPFGNTSAMLLNDSCFSAASASASIITAVLILVSFLVGIIMNGSFLWVLGMKMKRTVNTLWFIHLILSYLLTCFLMPFFAVYIILDFHWALGEIMCKIVLSSFSVMRFTTVFLLTVISLDRYLFTCHSVWSQRFRTAALARRLITGVWLASLLLSAYSLLSLKTERVNGQMKCGYSFVFSKNTPMHLAFFLVQFLLAFLLPFIIILGCYCWISCEMKTKRLVRTGKPFRVLVAAVASFFICWLPFHLYHAALLASHIPEQITCILWDLAAAGVCFNVCGTPIIYLFVGEKFQQVFKTSMLTLLNKGFVDVPSSPGDNANTTEDGGSGKHTQLKVRQGFSK